MMSSEFGRGSQVVRQGSAKAPFRRFDSDPRLKIFPFRPKNTASISENPGLILDGTQRGGGQR